MYNGAWFCPTGID